MVFFDNNVGAAFAEAGCGKVEPVVAIAEETAKSVLQVLLQSPSEHHPSLR